eukprot:TRINITY_DN32205_c0_g1_i4.p1 TRINITY_DN32205_c0_g1~~TRINITY_DN32205_c0_g1_i4.p1  ORF type:complete len:118 (+),score=35.52 TRINITY_DN32205_c0_g1_i4:111-464(+)
MGVAADLVELQDHMTAKQRDKVGALLIASTLQNLGNKTWLSGLSDMVGALDDPQRNSSRVLNRLAASLAVPAIVAQTARTMDPTLREAKTILDSIRAQIGRAVQQECRDRSRMPSSA